MNGLLTVTPVWRMIAGVLSHGSISIANNSARTIALRKAYTSTVRGMDTAAFVE
jgi:hypothetical protein